MDYRCFRCQHELMTCPYCGASYEVYDTPEEEQENYPYFKEENAKVSVV